MLNQFLSKFSRPSFLITLLLLLPLPLSAEDVIDIATIERPPFSMKQNNEWTGFSIDLINAIATSQGLTVKFHEKTVFADMLAVVSQKDVDMAAANISITAERETTMDFSQPIYSSGLQIITHKNQNSFSLLAVIWESGILLFLGGALVILLIVAHLMWFFERGEDAKHDYFRDEYFGGIWDAFWWAFVICTMGGFEKERPEHLIGRVIAVFWILASLFFISTLTAKITSALTVSQLNSGISSYQDLYGRKVGAPKGTTISQFLEKENIPYIEYDDFNQTLADLKTQKLDAVVGDAAVSQFYVQNQANSTLVISGEVFAKDNIALAFAEESPYFERVNGELIKMQEDGRFQRLQTEYFGR